MIPSAQVTLGLRGVLADALEIGLAYTPMPSWVRSGTGVGSYSEAVVWSPPTRIGPTDRERAEALATAVLSVWLADPRTAAALARAMAAHGHDGTRHDAQCAVAILEAMGRDR